MLKGLDPLLTPELLQVMAEMGHGDELVLSDCNFPTDSVAASTVHGRPIRLARDRPSSQTPSCHLQP